MSELPWCDEIRTNRLEIYYFLINFLTSLAYVHFLLYLCALILLYDALGEQWDIKNEDSYTGRKTELDGGYALV